MFSPTASEIKLDKSTSPSLSFSLNQIANPAKKLISLLIHSPAVLASKSLTTMPSSAQYLPKCGAILFSMVFFRSDFSFSLSFTFSPIFSEIHS